MKTRQCFIPICIITVITLFMLLPVWATAQQAYYYTFDGKIVMLEPSYEYLVIKLAELQEREQLPSKLHELFPTAEVQELGGVKSTGFFTVRSGQPLYSEPNELRQLQEDLQLSYVEPVYLFEGNPLIPYDVFSVKLRQDDEFDRLLALNEVHNVEILGRNALLPNLITLRLNDTSNYSIIEIAQKYFHELDLKYSTPDFFQNIQRQGSIADPYFDYQFYMHMTSAEHAWRITTGSENITVAVIDDGVMAHEDLPASRLVNGYDAFGITNGAPGGNEAHGMATAEIIAASHNSVGIAGMAPEVKVMPVRIFDHRGFGASDTDLVDAFTHAVTNGAHVINNSWGYGTTSDVNTPLTNVITNAMQNGRGGLGTIVVFASGNAHQSFSGVIYPANITGVIAVGAVNSSDVIFNYSSRGSQLDLVVPSGQTGSFIDWGPCGTNEKIQLNGTVWSLDQPGSNGWNSGNTQITSPHCYNEYLWSTHSGQPTPAQPYTAHYGGTFAAAPQVAGVAALILTENPTLSLTQVRTILHSTTDWSGHMGGSPPNHTYGYGRLNTNKAVKAALPSQYSSHSFSSNTTMNSASIRGTTSISAGVTLTVPSGKVVVLEGTLNGGVNSKIVSNGKVVIEAGTYLNGVEVITESSGQLIAKGTSGTPITFDGKGLVFQSGSNGTVSYATIKNATTGIWATGSSTTINIHDNVISDNGTGVHLTTTGTNVLITENVIEDNTIGMWLYQSNAVVSGNIIESNTYGMNADYVSSTAEHDGNKVRYNTTRGLFLNASNLWVTNSVFAGNGGNQVLINDGWPSFAESPGFEGYNVIAYGGGPMLKAQNGAYVFMGYSVDGGYNSFYETDMPHIRAENNSGVWADRNYWEGGPGNSMDGTSWVTSSNTLSTDPNPPYYQKMIAGNSTASTYDEADNHPRVPEELLTAMRLGMDGEMGQGLSALKSYIENNSQSLYVPLALISYNALVHRQMQGLSSEGSRQTVQAELTAYLQSQSTTVQSDALWPYAVRLLANNAMLESDYEIGRDHLLSLAEFSSDDSVHNLLAHYNLFTYYLEVEQNYEKATSYLGQLLRNHPDHELTQTAHVVAEIYLKRISEPIAEQYGKEKQIPDLVQVSSYPNPFNPNAVIRFSIPETGQVRLAVFDVLGRQVSELVNGSVLAGFH